MVQFYRYDSFHATFRVLFLSIRIIEKTSARRIDVHVNYSTLETSVNTNIEKNSSTEWIRLVALTESRVTRVEFEEHRNRDSTMHRSVPFEGWVTTVLGFIGYETSNFGTGVLKFEFEGLSVINDESNLLGGKGGRCPGTMDR